MRDWSKTRRSRRQKGIALLISIFVLLLISVVAIALIVSSGTESAMAGNYRTATSVYYAALAGLEEARGRLLGKNTNSFKNTAPTLLPSPGTALPVGQPFYIINPVSGETVAPWDPTSLYPDTEFATEFSSSGYSLPNPSPSTGSLTTVAGIQGPLFKWVRVNAVSEKSLNLDVDSDGTLDPSKPIYYDGTRLNVTSTGAQVFEITSFAILPNGSQKMLQYIAAPVPVILPPFNAALILAGNSTNGVSFTPPAAGSNPNFIATGQDLPVAFCTTGAAVHAIGVFDNTDVNYVIAGGNGGTGIPASQQPKYIGTINPGPDVSNLISLGQFPSTLQMPSQFDALAQTITQNADVVITPTTPPVNGTQLSAATTGMGSSNPMTVVINGDLDLSSWHNSGYGLLLVTGNLNYDPDATWNGIVLLIGKGTMTGNKGGSGIFNGGVLAAQTRDSSGNLLADPNLGTASMTFIIGGVSMGGYGFQYSSCWINAAQPTADYKILSFHEIAQ